MIRELIVRSARESATTNTSATSKPEMPDTMSIIRFIALLACAIVAHSATAAEAWFEQFKKTATPEQLYTFLYALPKGADLHNHLGGAVRSEWMWTATLAQKSRGYSYYTKVRINNCVEYGANEFGPGKYMLLFRNLKASAYEKLDQCQKSEYKSLESLDERERTTTRS